MVISIKMGFRYVGLQSKQSFMRTLQSYDKYSGFVLTYIGTLIVYVCIYIYIYTLIHVFRLKW
jgi:hypothetical protein